jgi:hypothetical protein
MRCAIDPFADASMAAVSPPMATPTDNSWAPHRIAQSNANAHPAPAPEGMGEGTTAVALVRLASANRDCQVRNRVPTRLRCQNPTTRLTQGSH